MEHVEKVPKILPTWHDYWVLPTYQLCEEKGVKTLSKDKFPDFGGAGIDTFSCPKGNDLTVAKQTNDKVIFGASVCTLPFSPPKKVFLESDPCMSSIDAANSNLRQWYKSVLNQRKLIKYKSMAMHNRRLSSIYTVLKDLQKSPSCNREKLSVSSCIVDLAVNLPAYSLIQEANFNYLGGCLVASQTLDGHPVLLHPTGKSLNKLGITPIVEDYSQNKVFKTAPETYCSKKLKKTCIQKIRSSFTGHSFVQQENVCHYVNFTDPSEICSYQLERKHGNFVNIQTSPYNPNDFLSTDETGVLELFDVESWKTPWCSVEAETKKSKNHPLLKDCSFGSHPKSVLLLADNSVYAHDLRTQQQNGSLIFSKHLLTFPREKLVTMKSLSSFNPFQYLISSSHHLYMIDVRYPEKPVLIWNHLLESLPFYCDIACVDSNSFSSDAIALVASQVSSQTCLLNIRFPKLQFQPVSLCNPLYPSVCTDLCDSLKMHCVFLPENMEKRIKNPLVGVSIVPHRQNGKGFTCFQLSSCGDIFYQDFREVFDRERELTYSFGAGCVLTPPEKVLPHISPWLDFFSKDTNTKKPSFFTDPSNNRTVDLSEYLRNTSSVSFGCNICSGIAFSRYRKVVLSSTCSTCGLNNEESNKILKDFKNLSLSAGISLEENPCLDFFQMTSSDLNSKDYEKISNVWNVSDNFEPHADTESGGKSTGSCSPSMSYSNQKNSSVFQSIASSNNSDHEDETKMELNSSQESTCDFVPPSQDIRPLVGETIRKSQVKRIDSSDLYGGGFC